MFQSYDTSGYANNLVSNLRLAEFIDDGLGVLDSRRLPTKITGDSLAFSDSLDEFAVSTRFIGEKNSRAHR